MLGLLQAYGSDEDSDSESDAEEPHNKTEEIKLPNPFELPKPSFDVGTSVKPLEKSVFVNPYIEADNAKQALLEKHVKMISTDVKTVNGKKICWNYRKSKCRFGHNCKYAHDSDLQMQPPDKAAENQYVQIRTGEHEVIDEDEVRERGKKRPGLSQTLAPSKKVIKMYNQQKHGK